MNHQPEAIAQRKMKALKKLVFGLTIAIVLSSCTLITATESNSWKTYRNRRYGFEFPYPGDWVETKSPSNIDGQAFNSPQNRGIEIRAWGAYDLSNPQSQRPNASNSSSIQNFTTEQGLSGQLQIDIGPKTSSMKLTLVDREMQYYWEAEAPTQEFDDYYKFFYYVASQYRVPQSTNDDAQ